MPISLICGACEATLTAPDAAAGKRVQCRKCQAILEVPLPEPDADYEVVEEPAPKPAVRPAAKQPPPPAAKALSPVAKAKPKPVELELDDDEDDERPAPKKKKPVVLEVDDDEDDRPAPKKKKAAILDDDDMDEEDEAPRKKLKKKGKKAAAANTTLPLLIGGGVLGLALVGFLVWYLAIREPDVAKVPILPPQDSGTVGSRPGPITPDGPVPGKDTPPNGWKTFTGDGFTCWLPQNVTIARNAQAEAMGGKQTAGAKIWTNVVPPVYTVSFAPLPASATAEFDRDPQRALVNAMAGVGNALGSQVRGQKQVTVGGLPGRQGELTAQGMKMVVQLSFRNGSLIAIQVTGPDLTGEADDRVKPFFDGFRLTN